MKYTNVPLPTPIIRKIDTIIAKASSDYRSRPDFILHHIRNAIANHFGDVVDEKQNANVSQVRNFQG